MLTNPERTFKMDSMRLWQRDNGVWYVTLTRGKHRSLKTCNEKKARKAFKKLENAALLNKLISIDPEQNVSLSAFTTEYLDNIGPTKEKPSQRSDKLSLETFTKSLDGPAGSRPLHTINRKHLDTMISKLLKRGLEPRSINTYIRRIKAAFNVAVEWKYIKENPFAKVKQLKVEKRFPRFLYGKEIKKLFAAITDPDFKNMVLLYVLTGCRRAELVRLTWGDIKKIGRKYSIHIRKTKTSAERFVKTNKETVKLIKRMKRGKDDEFVFPRWRHPDSISKLFREYADNSGIPHIRLHDLRHTTASHLVMQGVDLKTVGEILGQTRTETTDIYAHLVPEHLENAMSKLEGVFNLHSIDGPQLVSSGKNKGK